MQVYASHRDHQYIKNVVAELTYAFKKKKKPNQKRSIESIEYF